jgi:exosome complex component RRP42
MTQAIWELKKNEVLEEIRNGKRLDGRKFDEYRELTITNDVSKNAEGSARVKLGKTDIAAGTKMLPGKPYPDSPDKGTISVGAELLPLANPAFEVGPPREEAIELARVVDRGIREAQAVDFKKLCIVEGEHVWISFIDTYVINDDGNLFDACALGAMSSLVKTQVPKLDEEYKVVKGEFSGKLEIQKHPILSTFAKIGNDVLLDPTLAEEKAMSARFSLSTTESDTITAYQKGGFGSFSRAEVDACIETAFKRAKDLRKKL